MAGGGGRARVFPSQSEAKCICMDAFGSKLGFFCITSCLNGQRGAFRELVSDRHFKLQRNISSSNVFAKKSELWTDSDGDNSELQFELLTT